MNIAAANGMDELMSYFWTHLDPDYKRMWELEIGRASCRERV